MKLFIFILLMNLVFPLIGDSSDPIRTTGDIGQIFCPVYGLLLTYENSDKDGRIQFYKSSFSTIVSTHLLKKYIDKDRPDKTNNNSFPSGHTSAAFSGATFIHKRYGIRKALPVYAIASFVGYSRVFAKKHYWEDVLAGAILAGINTWFLTSPYIKNSTEASINRNHFFLKFNF